GCVATPRFPLPSDSASARPSTLHPCGAWPTPSWSGAPRWTRSRGRRRGGDPKPFVRLSRRSRRLGKADAGARHPRRDDRRQQRGARDLRRDARDAQHHRQAEWRAARRRRLHLVHGDRRLERRLPGGRRTRRARLDRRAARLRARNTGARGTRALRPCAHSLEHSENAEGDPPRFPSRRARASSFLGGRSARRRAPWGALVLVVMKRDATKEEIDAVVERIKEFGITPVPLPGAVRAAGGAALRGGAFKPRSSPYTFRGMGGEGLEILAEARAVSGLPIVTEVLAPGDVEAVAAVADCLQIGARNMQNYSLLDAV